MTDPESAIESADDRDRRLVAERPRRMSAYYYGFDETGVDAVDAVLSAVAWAGKSFHLTEDWTDSEMTGASEQDRIQAAANVAADAFRAIAAQARKAAIDEVRGALVRRRFLRKLSPLQWKGLTAAIQEIDRTRSLAVQESEKADV